MKELFIVDQRKGLIEQVINATYTKMLEGYVGSDKCTEEGREIFQIGER